MLNSRALKISIIVVVVFAIAGVANALAAANTVPDQAAGEGVGALSGGTVSNVRYTVTNLSGAPITTLTLDFVKTAGGTDPTSMKIQLVASGAWYTCTAGTAPAWNCAVGDAVTLHDATQLRVITTNGVVTTP